MTSLPPFSNPTTSLDAAIAIEPHLNRLEAIVLFAIQRNGPLTAEQISEIVSLSGDTVRPRLVALRSKGLVIDSGTTRKTLSGRQAILWQAA